MVFILCLALFAAACGSDDAGSAAEPPGRGAPRALFASSSLVSNGEEPRQFVAQAAGGMPAVVSCRFEIRNAAETASWVSAWRLVHQSGGAFVLSLEDEKAQEALSRSGPGLVLAIVCQGRGGADWVRGEQCFTQPLGLKAPTLSPGPGGAVARLAAGGLMAWLQAPHGQGVSARQATWVLLADGAQSVALPEPAPGFTLHYWWASRAVPCLQGGSCDDSAWAEAMLWLRHSEVTHGQVKD